VAVRVKAGSGIKVPKPSAGNWPPPWFSGIFDKRRSEESAIATPQKVFCVRHRRAAIRELDASCRTVGATFSS
jgi:hypothetical protein